MAQYQNGNEIHVCLFAKGGRNNERTVDSLQRNIMTDFMQHNILDYPCTFCHSFSLLIDDE